MENASKALLIAGSVLIAIILIAVSVRVLNSTQGTTDAVETTMNATEIATFNNKFMAYAGTNKSIADVKAVANLVISSNATSEKEVVFNYNFGGGYSTTKDANTIMQVVASADTRKEYIIDVLDTLTDGKTKKNGEGVIARVRVKVMP